MLPPHLPPRGRNKFPSLNRFNVLCHRHPQGSYVTSITFSYRSIDSFPSYPTKLGQSLETFRLKAQLLALLSILPVFVSKHHALTEIHHCNTQGVTMIAFWAPAMHDYRTISSTTRDRRTPCLLHNSFLKAKIWVTTHIKYISSSHWSTSQTYV